VAGKSATLALKITGDASGAKKALEDTHASVGDFKKGLDTLSIGAAGAIGGLGLLAKGAYDAASDLQQSTGSINAVFGDWAVDIEQTAQAAAAGVGLSTSKYEEMAAVIGAQLHNAGMSHADMTAKTQDLIKTGADMAAVFGGTAADAVDALSSALKGEMDPIERYGVSLNQSAIQAQMVTDHTDKLTGAAQKSAQTQAILELITKQTAETHGQWADQSNTAAEKQQILSAQAENLKAKLGDALIPVVGDLMGRLTGVGDWMTTHTGTVEVLALVIGGLAAGILLVNGAVKLYEAGTKVAAAAQWLWNAAMSANPIGLIVVAIAAVVAGVILAYQHIGWFHDAVDKVGHALSAAFDGAKAAIGWVVDKIEWVLNKGGDVLHWIGNLFGASAPSGGGGAPAGAARGMYGASAGGAARLLTAGPSSAGGAGPSLGAGGILTAPPGDTYNITVTGALDPVAVADQIGRLLDDRARRLGRTAAFTVSYAT
jgi:hypothetical protein